MRRSDWADQKFAEYLVLAEYREATSSAKPSVTGYVSACCRSETRSTKAGQVLCIHCNRVCDTSSWWSPLSGGASRGGWDPRPVWDSVKQCWTSREQVMYCNPTLTRNTDATEARLARGADLIRSLTYLFDGRPRSMSAAQWQRVKTAWEAWLAKRDEYEVAALAIKHGRDHTVWTPEAIVRWVDAGRDVAWERFQRARKEKSAHPWARSEWAQLEAVKRRRAA